MWRPKQPLLDSLGPLPKTVSVEASSNSDCSRLHFSATRALYIAYIFISLVVRRKKKRKKKVLKRRNYKRNYIRTESDAENPTCQTNTAKSYVVSPRPDKSFITNSLRAIHTILSDPAYLCKNFRFLLTSISEIAQQSNIDIHSMAISDELTLKIFLKLLIIT